MIRPSTAVHVTSVSPKEGQWSRHDEEFRCEHGYGFGEKKY